MSNEKLVALTARIVSSYVGHNATPRNEIDGIVLNVGKTISGLQTTTTKVDKPKGPVPAVPVKDSVTDDYIVCLDDGKRFQSLKRHLGKLGMTPAEYRKKWGLPEWYPMTAAKYSERRQKIAKDIKFGHKKGSD